MNKYFLLLVMIFATISIFAKEEVKKEIIMLSIKSDFKLASKYILIDESIQTEVISEQTKSTEGCIEDSCIVNTGKMLFFESTTI